MLTMYHKDTLEKKNRGPGWTERSEAEEKDLSSKKVKSEKWYWPIDPVNILDIRQMTDDQTQSGNRGYLTDIIGGDSKCGFSKAGENMKNLKSSLMKIGMDVRQEEVVLEDDYCDPTRLRRPKEGSKPRLWNTRQDVGPEKCSNVFHAKSRDAGISASWTRFSQDEGFE